MHFLQNNLNFPATFLRQCLLGVEDFRDLCLPQIIPRNVEFVLMDLEQVAEKVVGRLSEYPLWIETACHDGCLS